MKRAKLAGGPGAFCEATNVERLRLGGIRVCGFLCESCDLPREQRECPACGRKTCAWKCGRCGGRECLLASSNTEFELWICGACSYAPRQDRQSDQLTKTDSEQSTSATLSAAPQMAVHAAWLHEVSRGVMLARHDGATVDLPEAQMLALKRHCQNSKRPHLQPEGCNMHGVDLKRLRSLPACLVLRDRGAAVASLGVAGAKTQGDILQRLLTPALLSPPTSDKTPYQAATSLSGGLAGIAS